MDALFKDLRYAGRGLLKNPGISIIAVLALALGVGLTTIMFSIVYGALHRGLPFDGAERLMHLERANPEADIQSMEVTLHDYLDWSERQRSFESLEAFYMGTVNVRAAGDRPERYDGGFMSAGALDMLGVQPLLGRFFSEEDARPGAPATVILGHEVWQNHFAGSRDVLGQVVTVNGEQGEVIGVMPEGFEFPVLQEVWVPLRLDPVEIGRGQGTTLEVIGVLRAGVELDAAMIEMTGIAEQLQREYPETNQGIVPVIKPYTDEFIGDEERNTLYAMLATVMLVLLIACANVANLLLARAAVRTRDVAIRTAIGASRWRVVVQLLTEAFVLAVVGAVLGTGIAWVGIDMFARAVDPTDPPFWLVFKLDAPILAFVVAVAALAALVSGIIPALRASSTDINAVLKDESRGSSSLQIGRLSRILVVAEVAMSVAMLVASGLMIKSVVRINAIEYGFPTDVFTARVGVFEERFADAEARRLFWEDVERRVAAIPGVRHATIVSEAPGTGGRWARIAVDGATYQDDRSMPTARWSVIAPSFFETFDVTPVQGRAITALDVSDGSPVVVVNESFVRQHFTDGQALGRRIRMGGVQSDAPWLEVVGVVPDLRLEGVGDPDQPDPAGFYVPLAQTDNRFLTIAAVVDGEPLSITGDVREAVSAADPDTPVYFVQTLQESIDQQMWFYRVFGALFAAFGAASLFLAAVGLYGVMSFSVTRRIQEMGIRMALGAEARQVLRLVLGQGMGQILIGLVVGSGLALLVARGIEIFLYGSRPWDPATYGLVFGVLALTGFLASVVPARRATRVDPMVALRYE